MVDDVILGGVGPFSLEMTPDAAHLAAATLGDSIGCVIRQSYFLCNPDRPSRERDPYTLLFENGRLVTIGWETTSTFAEVRDRYQDLGRLLVEVETAVPDSAGVWVNADSTVQRRVSCFFRDPSRTRCVVSASVSTAAEVAREVAGLEQQAVEAN